MRGYTKDPWASPNETICVTTCRAKDVAKLVAKIEKTNATRCVVLMDGDTPHKNFVDSGVYFEFFAENEPCMLVDLTQNERVKPHSISTAPYEKKHLPKIHSDDVMVRWIGARPGDVVKADGWFEVV